MTTLLSVQADSKTSKGLSRGYLTAIVYLSPSDSSGVDLCVSATAGCRAACLYNSGRARVFDTVNEARMRRTRLFLDDREQFLEQLTKEIRAFLRKASLKGLTPCIRLNGTSDRFDIVATIAPMFPDVQFYDYTKHAHPWIRQAKLPNYHLTFSWSGENREQCIEALQHGVNVAVPFVGSMPESFLGFPVINGDETDLRFLDRSGAIVGLTVKKTGKARESQADKFFVSLQSLTSAMA